jgi:hypothetical protein
MTASPLSMQFIIYPFLQVPSQQFSKIHNVFFNPQASRNTFLSQENNQTPSPDAHDIATASARVRPVVGHAR